MHPGLDRVHRAQPHRLEGLVVQLAAVVLAHTAFSQETGDQVSLLSFVLVDPGGGFRPALLDGGLERGVVAFVLIGIGAFEGKPLTSADAGAGNTPCYCPASRFRSSDVASVGFSSRRAAEPRPGRRGIWTAQRR
jgi:hypothetical protein